MRATAGTRLVRLATFAGIHEAGRVLRDFVAYLPTKALPALAGVVVFPILARRLSPTELGILTIAQTLVTLGWVVVGGWLATALIRDFPRHHAAATVPIFTATLGRSLWLAAASLGAFTVLLAVVGAFSSAVGANVGLISAAVAGLILQNTAGSLLAARLRSTAYSLFNVGARTLTIVVGVLAVLDGHGVAGYLAGVAVTSIATGLVGMALSWPRVRTSVVRRASEVRPWLRYGIPMSAAGVGTWALAFFDRYLLALLRDTGEVGIYTVGNVVGDKAVAIPAMAFTTAAGPLLVTAFERSGRERVEELMRSYTRVMLLIGMPIVAFLAAVSGPVVELLAGDRYSGAAVVAPIVATGSLIYALSLIAYTGLVIARRTWPMVYSACIGVAVNVVVNLVLIPPYGATGAAVATPLAMTAYLLAAYVAARRYASWRFPTGTGVRCLAAAGAGYGAALAAAAMTRSDGAAIAAAAAAGALVYLSVLLVLGERRAGAVPAAV